MNRDRSPARRALLRRLVGSRAITSQESAGRLLEDRGHPVTQATVSRDLAAIGAEKSLDATGRERYVLANTAGRGDNLKSDLARMMREFVLSVGHSGNLALLKTAPGSAAPVASALDQANPANVLGTIAGDDTVLVVARSANGGAGLARRLTRILEGVPR